MALVNIARDLAMVGVSEVHTAPVPMAGANAAHIAVNLTSLVASAGGVDVVPQISVDGANWRDFVAYTTGTAGNSGGALMRFTFGGGPLGMTQEAIGNGAAPSLQGNPAFQKAIGAVFLRLKFVGYNGAALQQIPSAFFTVDVNTFNT